ncbi:Uncharacterised protein (plasmid) [Tsukamurella tyrosinosolvens]|uniref:Uncharacterized protein n=1 Tax=Tsukamurella tyrosinosolvens TaxID=57704 RepID=A0A1H4VCC4_TSUTY|nr:hypothetical protein [Tsukamurella tyrosinosolvens]KXO91007.1 hypothetical protein AXK58_21490 [Tsukamurella tyrosinosolvens]SEC78719.1 hypothetical protein SAMN04489793_3194 [Tsukamurella tyrosinosolvens]VEH90586.1 Uncharacterised protein [Tsukamurella tyrosinosolvens]
MHTVYVATRANADAGDLEWRATESERDEALQSLKDDARADHEFGKHTVEVPDDVWAEGTEAISDYVYAFTDF